MAQSSLPPLSQLLDLSGKAALITGGARGIGYGIAYRLAEAGAGVMIADADGEAARKAAAELAARGWKAASAAADVTDEAQVGAMVDAAVSAHGSVDILVNNAGIYPRVPVLELDEEIFDRIVAVNLKGTFLASKAAAARMIAQGRGGAIINVTSIDALHPSMVGLAAYDATKHGVWGFTKNLALELAPHGIRVNAVAPGSVRTPGAGDMSSPAADAFIRKIPLGRIGEPDDIGTVALFLACGLSSYMTGAQVVADGGVLLS